MPTLITSPMNTKNAKTIHYEPPLMGYNISLINYSKVSNETFINL